ncbi:MAG: ribonuclease HII [Opitutales bacterium]
MGRWQGERLRRFDRQWLAEQAPPGILGIDEAGRGCLAGPVIAACVWIPAEAYTAVQWGRHCKRLDDSKCLTALAREELFGALENLRSSGHIVLAAAEGSVDEIATHNILGATRLAMQRALESVATVAGLKLEAAPAAHPELPLEPLGHAQARFLEVDGSVSALAGPASSAPLILVDGLPLKPFPWAHRNVVGGDGRSLAIAAASIISKVTRDRLMREFDTRYPGFNFASNKGYGSCKIHKARLLENGPCPLHRELFLRKLLAGETLTEVGDDPDSWNDTTVENPVLEGA